MNKKKLSCSQRDLTAAIAGVKTSIKKKTKLQK